MSDDKHIGKLKALMDNEQLGILATATNEADGVRWNVGGFAKGDEPEDEPTMGAWEQVFLTKVVVAAMAQSTAFMAACAQLATEHDLVGDIMTAVATRRLIREWAHASAPDGVEVDEDMNCAECPATECPMHPDHTKDAFADDPTIGGLFQ